MLRARRVGRQGSRRRPTLSSWSRGLVGGLVGIVPQPRTIPTYGGWEH
jgi:hypothetical protein